MFSTVSVQHCSKPCITNCAEVTCLHPAERYHSYGKSQPPQAAVEPCRRWVMFMLGRLQLNHDQLRNNKQEALRQSKERSRLLKLASRMSDHDYEHAGPVHKTSDELAAEQRERIACHTLQTRLLAELGTLALLYTATVQVSYTAAYVVAFQMHELASCCPICCTNYCDNNSHCCKVATNFTHACMPEGRPRGK